MPENVVAKQPENCYTEHAEKRKEVIVSVFDSANFEPMQPKSNRKDRAVGRGGDPTGVCLETDMPTIFVKEFKTMRGSKLRRMIFMALCCDLGIFIKRFISPLTNILTDSLHIPGGIATAFSLMFLVIAVSLMPRFGNGTIMGAVQSAIALAMGMVGSMGLANWSGVGAAVPIFKSA